MIYIFLGAPGVGKGTISEYLKKEGFIHISTGNIFREISNNKEDKLAIEVNELISQGKLINDKLTFQLIQNEFEKYDLKKQKIILDGYPRTLKQAKMLNSFFRKNKIEIDKVINLIVDREIIIERLTNRLICPNCSRTYHLTNPSLKPKQEGECDDCHKKLVKRSDDNLEKINYRLDVYEEFAKKIINYYQKKKILFEVDSSRNKEQILEEILKNNNNEK